MNSLFKTVTSSLKINDEDSVLQFQQYSDIEHKILIEDLELEMSIGILPEEKLKKQNVLISMEVIIQPQQSYDDNIENTVSYADIIHDIEQLTADKHFNLVETLAEEIADLCFIYPKAYKVNITVKKPDIIKNAKTVGFSLTKAKQDSR